MNREPDLDEQTFRVKNPLEVAKRRAEHEGSGGVPAHLDRTLDGGFVVTWVTKSNEGGELVTTKHTATYREPLA